MQEPLAIAQLQFEKFVALIESTVDSTYFKECGSYRILPSIDENLLAAAEKMCEIETKCNALLKKVAFFSTSIPFAFVVSLVFQVDIIVIAICDGHLKYHCS